MPSYCWVCPVCDYAHIEAEYHTDLLCGRCGVSELRRDYKSERVAAGAGVRQDYRADRVNPADVVMQPEDARRRALVNIAKRDVEQHDGPRRNRFGDPVRPSGLEVQREADKVTKQWNENFTPQKAAGDKYRPRTSAGTF